MQKWIHGLLAVIALLGWAGMATQFGLAWAGSSLVWHFPPLYPQIITLILLTIPLLFWQRKRLISKITIALAIIVSIPLVYFGIGANNSQYGQSGAVCAHTATKRGGRPLVDPVFPGNETTQPDIDFTWPGYYTCIWPADEDGNAELRYTQPIFILPYILRTTWS